MICKASDLHWEHGSAWNVLRIFSVSIEFVLYHVDLQELQGLIFEIVAWQIFKGYDLLVEAQSELANRIELFNFHLWREYNENGFLWLLLNWRRKYSYFYGHLSSHFTKCSFNIYRGLERVASYFIRWYGKEVCLLGVV
jgi:hypothetical protein